MSKRTPRYWNIAHQVHRPCLVRHSIWLCNNTWLSGGRIDRLSNFSDLSKSPISGTSHVWTRCFYRSYCATGKRRGCRSAYRTLHGRDILFICRADRCVIYTNIRYLQNIHQEECYSKSADLRFARHDLRFWIDRGCFCLYLECYWY